MDCNDAYAATSEPGLDVLRVGDGRAKHERARRAMLSPSLPEPFHAALRLHGVGEGFGIEAAVPPRDVRVVDDVLQPEVCERDEPSGLDPRVQVRAEGEVVVEEPEDVALVRAIRRRGQTEQKSR